MKKAISVLLSVMLLITTISAALTFTVGASDPDTEPVNLFTDGDFEGLSVGEDVTTGAVNDDDSTFCTPNANGWAKSSGWVKAKVSSDYAAHSGSNVLECTNIWNIVSRRIDVETNTDYLLSVWYYVPAGNKVGEIVVTGSDGTSNIPYNSDGTLVKDGLTVLGNVNLSASTVEEKWTRVLIAFNSGSFSYVDLHFKAENFANEKQVMLLDDISLTAVNYNGNLTNAKLDDVSAFYTSGNSLTVGGFKGEASGSSINMEAATADDLPEGVKDNNNVINVSGDSLTLQFYSASTYRLERGTSYIAYTWVKTNNIIPLRFGIYEKNYIDRSGVSQYLEKPTEGHNIYSYTYDDGSSTRPCRNDITYRYSINGNPTENGVGNASMLLTRDKSEYDPSAQFGDGGWVRVDIEFTVPTAETWTNTNESMGFESLPYESDISLGLWTATNTGSSSISIAAMEIEKVIKPEITVSSGDSEGELGAASVDKTSYVEGEEATFTATPYAGSTFDGWYKDGELYKEEATFTEALTGPIALEARFSSDYDNLFPEAGFENIALGDYIKSSSNTWQNGWSGPPNAISWMSGKVVDTEAATGSKSLEVFGRHQMLEKTVTLEANTDYMFNFSYFLPSYGQDIAEHHFNCVQIVQPDAEYNTTASNAYPDGTVIAIQHFGNDFAGEDSAPPIYNDQWVDNTVKFNTGDNTTVKIVLQYISEWNDNANFIYYDNFQLFKADDIAPNAPTITLSTEPDVRDWYTTAPDITITPAEENGFGLKTYFKFYSTEEEEPTEGTLFDGTQPEIAQDGRYYVKAWTEDSYGNTSTVASKLIKVSATPPEYTPGNINDDDEVDDTDVMVLARYLAQWDMSEDEYVVDAMDTNGDSSVDDNDVAHLRRYLAHWEGIELN